MASGTPSVLVQALQKQNYQIGTFTSTTLAMPEFDRRFAKYRKLIEGNIFTNE